MKPVKLILHIALTLLLLFLFLGIPFIRRRDVFTFFSGKGKTMDAISSASLVIPDAPDGEYLVYIRNELHRDTLSDWESFFRNEDFPVIFDDIHCLVANGDLNGKQLADRYMAQLPENQMQLRTEDPTLLASKLETGQFDVAILSPEMAGFLELASEIPGVTVLRVSGVND